ncbi:MAG TPA: hypothetical protein VGJ12_15450, partial [Gemmatimonadaceae bacterium]
MRVSVLASIRARVIAMMVIVPAAGAPARLRAQVISNDTVGSCWSYETADAHFQVQVVARGLSVPVS